jgi:hypothetical protein
VTVWTAYERRMLRTWIAVLVLFGRPESGRLFAQRGYALHVAGGRVRVGRAIPSVIDRARWLRMGRDVASLN